MISRNSAFVYKGKPINAQSVANELGVQYVVEGSVRERVRRIRQRFNAHYPIEIAMHHVIRAHRRDLHGPRFGRERL